MRAFKNTDSNLKLFLWMIGDIVMTFLRSLASAAGMVAAGALVGGVIGGGMALFYGTPLSTGLILGTIAGFALALVILIALSVGSSWF